MTFSDQITDIGDPRGDLQVRLSNQLIHLLSEQMYSSPLKAMEELVVNAYDADAKTCRINFVDYDNDEDNLIAVFDDGSGMNFVGLEQLWHVGESPKIDNEISPKHGRKVIGKFGIGKLATYAIANKITYLTHHSNSTFHVTCDFRRFKSAPEGGSSEAVPLTVKEITDSKELRDNEQFKELCEILDIDPYDVNGYALKSWTLCVLETLKPKAADLKLGRLKWVLRTAMPLKANFCIYVNGDIVERTEDEFIPVVKFSVDDLDIGRLASLNASLEDDWKWKVENNLLVSKKFPSGLTGEVIVTQRSLVTGKSADVGRSHGFFIFVRGRLVNESDELFGLHALSHATFNFFRADIYADDLHSEVTAPREGLELGKKRDVVSDLLLGLFNDARQRQQDHEREIDDEEKRKREHERLFVPRRLVEHPIADTLVMFKNEAEGTEADEGWFFIQGVSDANIKGVVEELYGNGPRKYRYKYDRLGKTERFVKLNPESAEFTLNEDHEVILAYSDEPRSRQLLEDLVASEVLLEVYLREAGINPHIIGEVLERRDMLMRSLAQDRVFSLDAIAQFLSDSRDDKDNLEIALIAASRALGFNAKHISKSGEPDGVARFNDYKNAEIKITLEAKSSVEIPELSSLDFSGLAEHMNNHQASGCLLVAPDYPGEKQVKKGQNSAVETRAKMNKISCWTIKDLARIVSAAETHQINARQVLDIVLEQFTPKDVSGAVDKLLSTDSMQDYYREILNVMKKLDTPDTLKNNIRTVQHISGLLAVDKKLKDVTDESIRNALAQMSHNSRGMVRLKGDHILFSGNIEEFERRISNLTGHSGVPRKLGSFRDSTTLDG